MIDARFRYVEGLRSWLALAAYPLQRAALAPIEVGERVAGYFSTQARLVAENERLRAKALELLAGRAALPGGARPRRRSCAASSAPASASS